ncbi:MAG: NVEALA domain-containing protein [Prevotellaceae bacterium]|nr:NVEALA domain-containing protein [Prevotellaceae bacterium]
MNKKLIGIGVAGMIAAFAYVNFETINDNDDLSDLTLQDVEALSDTEWNSWEQWLSQGLTKDEREMMRPCPSTESSSGSGSIGVGNGNTNVEVGGSGSHEQTNPSGRKEIVCPYGNTNCTEVAC